MNTHRSWSRVWRDIALTALALVVAAALTLWLLITGSLPQLDGEIRGLTMTATIDRDVLGTPAITAANRQDLAFATGFAHAQDRFFQMDLMRRAAAGELAELLGSSVVERDRDFRTHDLRRVAGQVVAAMPGADRDVLESYVRGVNAGMSRLRVRPWEYLVLGAAPRMWSAEDSMLCAFAMYLTLHDPTGRTELTRAQLRESLPPELFGFLFPVGTEWDAPLSGGMWRTPPIPSATVFDLRRQTPSVALAQSILSPLEEADIPGSNAWAVDGAHAAAGRALLANDMHLGLRLPHVWYRARLIVTDPAQARDLVGVTLPGLPVLIVGSNGRVAWGLSNSYGDWTDLVVVEIDPQHPDRYFVGDATEALVHRREIIRVRDADPVTLDVLSTRWGPVVAHDAQRRPLALAWTAHDARATNMRMLDLEQAQNVAQALSIANRAGAPVQNFVAADSEGHIGWTLMGQVPARANYDATLPQSWRAPGTGWIRWRTPDEYPQLIDPPTGRVWTANARPIDAVQWLDFAGAGNYDAGARAGQIRDGLLALPTATEADMTRIQLDDRALFLMRWRDLLLEVLERTGDHSTAQREQARRLVEGWSGTASISDVGYGIVRAFRLQVRKDAFDALTSTATSLHPESSFEPSPQFEGALWQLVTQRPDHLLDPRYRSWDDALLASLDTALGSLVAQCGNLPACTWGRQNTLQMRHPLSAALPWLSGWLDMPAVALPGDAAMPRVQGTRFGASERLVVTPGHEAEGLLQLPGGPVDHPLSPFYGAGHAAWVEGAPVALLPGKPVHSLHLRP